MDAHPIEESEGGRMSASARIAQDRVEHDTYMQALDAIKRSHDSVLRGDGPDHALILGVSGVGKTSAVETYANRFPRKRLRTGTEVPVVYVKIPARPTIKSLFTALLTALGAPAPSAGRSEDQGRRFIQLAIACKVQLVIADETHHFVDRGGVKTHAAVADALKVLMDDLKVSFVFVGAPRAYDLFRSNSQMRNRARRTVRMRPFAFNCRESLAQYVQVVLALCEAMPPDLQEKFRDAALIERLLYASDGLIRVTVQLLRAITKLHEEIPEQAIWELCKQAFENEIAYEIDSERNPFSDDFILRRLDRVNEPYEPSFLDGDNHA